MKPIYYFCIFFFLTFPLHAKKYRVSKSTAKLLNSLPKKSFSLNVILKKGLTTDSFEIIKLQNLEEKVIKYTSKIPFSTYLSAWFLKGTEKYTNYNRHNSLSGLRLNRNFSTGTTIFAESNYANNSFSSFSSRARQELFPEDNSNKINLNIRQNLLKDIFGYASRKKLKALNLKQQNVQNQFFVNTENWTLQLIKTFYTAWFLQSTVRLATDNYNRQKRLRKITYLKFKRAVSKKSDFLQTKSAEKNSKQNLNSAKQDLENTWRNLVIKLSLSEQWLNVNPLLIPIVLDNPVFKAKKFCKKDLDLESNLEFQFLKKKYNISQLNLSAAKNQMLPEVFLNLKFKSNTINKDTKIQNLKNSLINKNRGFALELGLSVPLERYKEKSQLAQAQMTKSILQRHLSSLKKTLKINWKNECLNLLRLIEKKKELKSVKFMQQQRANLTEKHFRIGKSVVFNTVQAGIEATLAKLAFKKTEIDVRLSAWKILKMNSTLINYINNLINDKK